MKYPKNDAEYARRNFSLSRVVKRLIPGKELRDQLAYELAPHYQDALFATPNEPFEVPSEHGTLQLFPSKKNLKKIRVQVKR